LQIGLQVPTRYQAHVVRSAAWDIGARFAVAQRVGQTTRPTENSAQLITTNDQIRYAVGIRIVLLSFSKRQVVTAIRGQLLVARVAVAPVSHLVIPGVEPGLLVERSIPLVVPRDRQSVFVLLRKSDLQSVE